MKIYFCKHGYFGNNIFQYIVAKILCKEYGHQLVGNQSELVNPINVTDDLWYRWSIDKTLLGHADIFLNGFFQRLDLLYPYRDYIKTLFHKDNHEWINDSVRISDIANNYETTDTPDDDEIVIHLRLGDFMHNNYNSHILHHEYYTQVLDRIYTGGKVTIISNKLTNHTEEQYVSRFDKYGAVFRSKTMLDDFNYIRKAKRVVSSNSTFAFIASFIGDPTEVYIPWTNFYKEQAVYPFIDNCSIINARCIDIYSNTVRNYL